MRPRTRSPYSKLKDPIQRFFSYVSMAPTGCWNWIGGLHKSGYGVFAWSRGFKNIGAHRIAYAYWHGKSDASLAIDHICNNRKCVRPEHLQAITHQENFRRSPECNANRTRCRNCDSELTPVYAGHTKRGCRNCGRAATRQYGKLRWAYLKRLGLPTRGVRV